LLLSLLNTHPCSKFIIRRIKAPSLTLLTTGHLERGEGKSFVEEEVSEGIAELFKGWKESLVNLPYSSSFYYKMWREDGSPLTFLWYVGALIQEQIERGVPKGQVISLIKEKFQEAADQYRNYISPSVHKGLRLFSEYPESVYLCYVNTLNKSPERKIDNLYREVLSRKYILPSDGAVKLKIFEKGGKQFYVIYGQHYSAEAVRIMHEEIVPEIEKPEEWGFLIEGGPESDIPETNYAYGVAGYLNIPAEDPIISPFHKEVIEKALKEPFSQEGEQAVAEFMKFDFVKDRKDVINLVLMMELLATLRGNVPQIITVVAEFTGTEPSYLFSLLSNLEIIAQTDPLQIEKLKSVGSIIS
jgi:hypothetical protein